MDKVGNAIKERRKMLKITQRTLAELASVGINTLTKIERGEGNPTIEVLEKILDTLGLELQIGIKQRNELRTILQGAVYMNGKLAGILTEISPTEYVFKYDDTYYADDMQPAVSLTLPKTQQEYRSAYLFPFFSNMLSEGRNRIVQSRMLHIDENDHFGILLATAQTDVAGAVTVKPL